MKVSGRCTIDFRRYTYKKRYKYSAMHVRNQIISSGHRNYINPPEYWRVMTDDNGCLSLELCTRYTHVLIIQREANEATENRTSRESEYTVAKGIMNKFQISLNMSICFTLHHFRLPPASLPHIVPEFADSFGNMIHEIMLMFIHRKVLLRDAFELMVMCNVHSYEMTTKTRHISFVGKRFIASEMCMAR